MFALAGTVFCLTAATAAKSLQCSQVEIWIENKYKPTYPK